MTISVEEYCGQDRTSPFERWFSSLDAQAAAKVSTAILRMEMGNTSNIKWFDGLGEYRIHWGPGYRIYLLQEGKRLIILFGGGNKSSQKQDIKQAKKLIAEYRSRKNTT
ncbi:type II toxin-antitoxin system RelE/ParE family toxin [Pseudomonas deceptionensis]|uniref:Addiction module killer protein n=1 Tax=Pseudomonas deceptionensis TaxID=882211 RepID=A0A0J6G366_PSEDM|nr:type II toxin-antitoxin system RelE/ParE family toxin [Pseudomonas deceptionensis]KMM79461.1 addiction module protein [Pseudomonas deceptionensis]SEE24846.1 putative addiction module killer protein [Pseudomonas deceptionensis]